MNREEKQILACGEDSRGSKYYYYCRKCRTKNLVSSPTCTFCGTKRPRRVLEEAQVEAPVEKKEYGHGMDRTARNAYPEAPKPCFAVPMPSNGNFDPEIYIANSRVNLPVYYMTDEYGRVYRAKVTYGAMPCSAPVPVPTPSKVIQTSTINVPLK